MNPSLTSAFSAWLSFSGLLTTIVLLAGFYLYFWFFSRPMNKVFRVGEVGFFLDKSASNRLKDKMLERIKRIRSIGPLPPVFPNGWFCVAESGDVKAKQLKPIVFMGQNLTLFRAEKGTVHVVDSYCPHLGADFNVGGRVVNNDCVQCPFHGWVFSGVSGKCTVIPYSSSTKIPESARIDVWPVVEKNGHIYVWYHCDRHEPEWEIPAIEEIENGKWQFKGRTEHEILCHVEEIPENGADTAHLGFIHGIGINEGSDITEMEMGKSEPLIKHIWTNRWEPDDKEKHVAKMYLDHVMTCCGVELPYTTINMTNVQLGAGVVHMYLECVFGRAVIIQSVTPEEAMLQRLRFVMYGDCHGIFAKFAMKGTLTQLERDIYIWMNKRYVKTPIYCKDDGPIGRHRRWFSQFYSENSPRLNKDGSLTDRVYATMDW